MAIAPETVYTHRIALAAEYGFDPMQITADGFTDEYLEVVGDHTNGDMTRRLILESNSVIRTRIYWPNNEARTRARKAMNDDFREMVGDDFYHQLQTQAPEQYRD